ncbi:MAG: hypothetical protein AAFP97_11925, partial [Pseudomonadota bacterium]
VGFRLPERTSDASDAILSLDCFFAIFGSFDEPDSGCAKIRIMLFSYRVLRLPLSGNYFLRPGVAALGLSLLPIQD